MPVVTSDLPVLRDWRTREVSTGRHVDALAAALAAAVEHDGGAPARSQRRAWAETFTWRCARETLAAYRLALG